MRIMRGDYQIPSGAKVSAECRDLLAKVLTVSPRNRITVQGIQQHPWCVRVLAHAALKSGRHASMYWRGMPDNTPTPSVGEPCGGLDRA
jgi:hypothetical protein